MNTFSIVLIVAVIFLIMASVIYSLFQKLKDFKKVVKELENAIADKNKSMAYLLKHAEELANIQMYENEVKTKIEEAKSDEEIASIVDSIISVNNSIMQDDQDGGE